MWFKANSESLVHEVGVVEVLSRTMPDRVPPLLASDSATGWMLMADAGRPLREVVPEERSLDRWYDALAAAARLQIVMEDRVPELLALGVPDRRLTTLPDSYATLMHQIDAEPRFRHAHALVVELADELAAFAIPETLQHDDLHDGQVFVRDDVQLVLDWGDACISHPFFTLSVSLEGVIAWGLDDEEDSVDTAPFRDAYLAVYADHHHRERRDLVEAARVATRLGWACRAVNGHLVDDLDATLARLRMFVDARA